MRLPPIPIVRLLRVGELPLNLHGEGQGDVDLAKFVLTDLGDEKIAGRDLAWPHLLCANSESQFSTTTMACHGVSGFVAFTMTKLLPSGATSKRGGAQ